MGAEHSADGSFWDFSLGFYALPEVAAALLELQDEGGADVNVMLFLLYLARSGHQLSAAEVERIDGLAAPWRASVVIPLRSVRHALKSAVGEFRPAVTAALRSEIKRVELAAEHLQHEVFERLIVSLPPPAGDNAMTCARLNLQCYAEYLGNLPAGPISRILERFAAVRTP